MVSALCGSNQVTTVYCLLKHGGCVIVWRDIGAANTGQLQFIEGNMHANVQKQSLITSL